MKPEEPTNPLQSPGNDQAPVPSVQPGVTYQPTPVEPQVIPLDPAAQQAQPTSTTPPVQPQQYSNPFAGQPFINQSNQGQTVLGQSVLPNQPPLTPTPGQPVTHRDAKHPKTKTTKHLLVALAILLGLAAILTIAYIFLVYIPNKPQNVWNTGLNRTGMAADKIINNVAQKNTLESLKKSEVNAVLTASAGDASYSGELHVKYDAANAAGDLKVTQKTTGQEDKIITSKFMSQFKETAQFPTLFFQFAGFKSLGLSDLLPKLGAYENKWIVLDESYFKKSGVTTQQAKDSKDKQITSDDVYEVVTAFTTTTGQYLFTTNPKTALFEQRRFVAKEKVDGKTAYHYIVGINKQHAKDYCAALADSMVKTQLYKKYASEDEAKQKDSLTKSCQDSVDKDIKDTDSFDMWIDARYKLIYKLRFTDEKDKNIYTDIGENYKGGSDMSFFVTKHNGTTKTDTKFALEPNFKTHVTKAALTIINQGTSPSNVKIAFEAKPYTGDIKIDAPAGAVPLEEVLKTLDFSFGSGTKTSDNDTERMADVKAIHAQLEAYYTSNKRYPTIANLNDAKWLKANFPGLDVAAFKDPENSSSALVGAAAPQRYAYQATAKDSGMCDNVKKDCAKYTLTATLSDGTTYVKQSLN